MQGRVEGGAPWVVRVLLAAFVSLGWGCVWAGDDAGDADAGSTTAPMNCPEGCPFDDYACYPEAVTKPSFAHEVLPALRSCIGGCHVDTRMNVPLWLGPSGVDALTPQEIDAAHAELLGASLVMPMVFRVEPEHPGRSLLMLLLDGCLNEQAYPCEALGSGPEGGPVCFHRDNPSLSDRPLRDMVRDWILNGAANDSERVAPPGIDPILHATLREKDGQSRTSLEIEAFSLGHDISRGVSRFTRASQSTERPELAPEDDADEGPDRPIGVQPDEAERVGAADEGAEGASSPSAA
jgi:hypothetical protein